MFSLCVRGRIVEKCTKCGNNIPIGMIRECNIDHEGFFSKHIDCLDFNKKPKWWVE